MCPPIIRQHAFRQNCLCFSDRRRSLYANAIDRNIAEVRQSDRTRSFAIEYAVSRKLFKRDRQQRFIHRVPDQNHRKPAQRLLQQIPAVDQRIEPVCMQSKLDHDLRMQRMSFPDLRQFSDQSRKTERRKSGKQRGTDRHGPDHRSVRIYAAAELDRQKHRHPARQRCRQQQNRDRPPCAGFAKEQKRRQQESRDLAIRFPQQRDPEQRDQRINSADQ